MSKFINNDKQMNDFYITIFAIFGFINLRNNTEYWSQSDIN